MWLLWIVYLFAPWNENAFNSYQSVRNVENDVHCIQTVTYVLPERCEDDNRLRISPGQVIIAISFRETQAVMNKIMQVSNGSHFDYLYLLRNSPSKTAQANWVVEARGLHVESSLFP